MVRPYSCVNPYITLYRYYYMGALFRLLALGSLVFCVGASAAPAQRHAEPTPPAQTIPLSRIPRVTRPPKLSDFIDGRAREAELTVTDFRQNIPGDVDPASENTTAYL